MLSDVLGSMGCGGGGTSNGDLPFIGDRTPEVTGPPVVGVRAMEGLWVCEG